MKRYAFPERTLKVRIIIEEIKQNLKAKRKGTGRYIQVLIFKEYIIQNINTIIFFIMGSLDGCVMRQGAFGNLGQHRRIIFFPRRRELIGRRIPTQLLGGTMAHDPGNEVIVFLLDDFLPEIAFPLPRSDIDGIVFLF